MKHINMKAHVPPPKVQIPYDIGRMVNILICLVKRESVPGVEPDWGTCGGHMAFCPVVVEESHWETSWIISLHHVLKQF